MPVVQMPAGQLVDMPDNPTPEQLAALKKVAAQAPQESTWDTVKHKAKLFASDVVKGVAGLPALILDAAAIDPETGLPPKESFSATKALQGSMTTPKTEADKWQSVITQGAAGGALSGNPAQGAFVGGVSGATSEGSARLFGEGLLPRLLGGLAGGLGAGAAVNRVGRISANAEALAKEALEGIDPTLLAKAKTFMEASGRQGVSMDIAQALEAVGAPASNITTIRNVLANNKAGDRVQMILRGQPTELQLRATTAIGGMPGTVWGEQQAANNLQETATKAIEVARKDRTAAVRPLYDQAGRLGNQFRAEVLNDLSIALTVPGLTEQAAITIKDAIAKIRKLPANGTRADWAADYDEIIRSLRGPFKGNPLTPNDPRTAGQLGEVAATLSDRLKSASPETAAAAARYAQLSQDVVDPLKQGPVGQLATPRGYKPDVQAAVSKMNGLFAAGVDPQAKVSSIKQAASELAKVDKTAFADAAKTYYSGKIAQVFEPTIGGAMATNGQAAERLWQALFANEKQYQGMKDTVTSVAKTYGLSEQAAARGLENFAQITKALRSRPATAGGLARDEVFRMGGKNYGADALRIFGFLPFERAARRLEGRTMQNAFRDFDNLLTTPEGVDKLIQLSKVPAISDKALTILSTLGGTAPGVGAAVNTQGVTTE